MTDKKEKTEEELKKELIKIIKNLLNIINEFLKLKKTKDWIVSLICNSFDCKDKKMLETIIILLEEIIKKLKNKVITLSQTDPNTTNNKKPKGRKK